MLSTSTAFKAKHELDYKTPMYLIQFDGEAVDYCNHKPLNPTNSLKQYLAESGISGVLRTVKPEEGTGTVGGVKVNLIDYNGEITGLLATDANYFARKQTVIKAGYLGMEEADMLSIFTGWVTAIKMNSNLTTYEFSVTDPQRWQLRKIFRGAEDSNVSLSGNPLNILLAVLLSTGNGTNGAHDRYAAENGLGIDQDFIDVAGIERVRDDYFAATSHKMTFTIKKKVKAKQWIEDEILKPLNLYPAIDGSGRYSVKPSKPNIEAVDMVQTFNEDNIIGFPKWDMNLVETINEVEFNYDYNSTTDGFDSQLFFTDQDSVIARGPGKITKIDSHGFNTDDNALEVITRRWNTIKKRYSNPPPIKISVQCFFTQLLSEPGDVVPFSHRLLPDLSTGTIGLSGERMEVIQISVDWNRGICKVDFLQTGFAQGTSQVISPAMTVLSAVDRENFTASTADAAKYQKFTLPEIQLRSSKGRYKAGPVTLLTIDADTGACTCDDFGITPVVGDVIVFADYDDSTDEQKLWGYIGNDGGTIGASGDAAHLIIP